MAAPQVLILVTRLRHLDQAGADTTEASDSDVLLVPLLRTHTPDGETGVSGSHPAGAAPVFDWVVSGYSRDMVAFSKPAKTGAGLGLPENISAVLFDLDGVLTDTAEVHRKAWKEAFDGFLDRREGSGFHPFTEDDYLRYVDGRSRIDGVREFLASREITLPEGRPEEEPGDSTVHGIGNRKNRVLLSTIENDGVRAYPGSVDYLYAVDANGLPACVVTSSMNATAVLAATDLARFFEAIIDGNEIERRQLRGKPAPDAFLAGAQALGMKPAQTAVFEDAVAGVSAGRDGGFAFVVGVDRVGDGRHAEDLRRSGADVVVTDLAQLRQTP